MKTKIAFIIILVGLFMGGCIVKSLHPFYKESDVLYREDLVGVWSDQKNGKWQILPFEKKNAYAITLTSDEGVAATFIAHLFSLGNTIYLDFVPEEQEGKQVDLFALHLIPSHSLARVQITSSKQLSIEWLNEEWLAELFERNKIRIQHEVVYDGAIKDANKMYILTASTDELQKFILKYGSDSNAFTGKSEVVMNLNRLY
jgi:hypothetical protein